MDEWKLKETDLKNLVNWPFLEFSMEISMVQIFKK